MLVYVLNKKGKPLMPCSTRKARLLLKEKKAKIVKRNPFTIKLKYKSSGYRQEISLGVDAGSKIVGISATTERIELFSSELHLRNDIVGLISTRRQNRRNRRNRLRHRQSRFLNRIKSKKQGWLAPSIKNKINAHIKIVNMIVKILPISKIVVESASFDINKINKLEKNNKKCYEKSSSEFSNIREYVLWRDNHRCKGRKGCKNTVLQVHHIESRKTGGDSPNNLITLCKFCHEDFHNGKLKKEFKRIKSTRDMAFMGIMRKTLFEKLRLLYKNIFETYGYITKSIRIENGIKKSHIGDARCISGNYFAIPLEYYFYIRQTRKHDRQIHRYKAIKNSIRVNSQLPYKLFGFRLYDKVKYNNTDCFIFSRRKDGFFQLRFIDRELFCDYAKYNKIQLLSHRNTFLLSLIKL